MTECGLERRCYECKAFLRTDASIICETVAAFSTYLVVNRRQIADKITDSPNVETSEGSTDKNESMIHTVQTRLSDKGVFVSKPPIQNQ